MATPAAKGRKRSFLAAALLAATAALLAPTPASASRYAPTTLEPRLTAPTVNLDAVAAAAGQPFALFTAADRDRFVAALAGGSAAATRFSLFPDFAPGPGGPGAWKLASGSSSWGDEPNARPHSEIAPLSQWRADLYQAFGYDGLNVTDPFGLLLPRDVLADPNTPLYKHEGGWYQVNDQGLVYRIDIDDGARHSWVKDEAVVAAVLQQAGVRPGSGDNPGLAAMGEVIRETALPVAEAIEKAVAVGTSLSSLGDINDAVAAGTGVDPLFGERLGLGGRLLSGAGVALPVVTGKELRGAVGLVESALDALADSRKGALGLVDEAGEASKVGPGDWVLKRENLGSGAEYQAAHVPGRVGQTYRVPYQNPNTAGRPYVDFDDFDEALQALVDYKTSVRTTKKGLDQALRQVAVSVEQSTSIVWRVPTRAQKLRAEAFFRRKGITEITVELAP